MKRAAIFGTSGAIGRALLSFLSTTPDWEIFSYSRTASGVQGPRIHESEIDYLDETALEQAAAQFSSKAPVDRVIITNGVLHQDEIQPEKALRMLSAENLRRVFEINTIVPALIAKHFAPKLNRNAKSELAFLTARAGSISDNEMGGWHSYRTAKAGLNMIAKNIAIEIGRRNKNATVALIHPGVVESELSRPFSRGVPEGKLISPEVAAKKITNLLDGLEPSLSGNIFELDGEIVAP